MLLTLFPPKKKYYKNIETDHWFYDHDSRKMFHGRGGRMILDYNMETKRVKPRIENKSITVRESSFDDLKKWVFNHQHEYGFSIDAISPGKSITIEINDEELDEITDQLHLARIPCLS